MDAKFFISSLLADVGISEGFVTLYYTIGGIILGLMFVAAIAAIILVMLTPGNSNGIDALGGSSETFYGKNKGKSTEAKLKLWTYICLGVLAGLSIILFIALNPAYYTA